ELWPAASYLRLAPQNGMASSIGLFSPLKPGGTLLASLSVSDAGLVPFHGATYGSTRVTLFLSGYSPILSFSMPRWIWHFLYFNTSRSVTGPVMPHEKQTSRNFCRPNFCASVLSCWMMQDWKTTRFSKSPSTIVHRRCTICPRPFLVGAT